jgi:hypothetical protein
MPDRAVLETVRLLARLGERVVVLLFVRPTPGRFLRYADDPMEALKL